MTFEQSVEFAQPPEMVWRFVMDVPAVAACLPGAEGLTPEGDDSYALTVKVRVGPIALALRTRISIVTADESSRTASMRMEAADKRVGGAVKATMTMRLEAAGTGTRMHVMTDATVMGRIGDFGQPIIRKKADQILIETGEAMRRRLSTVP